MGALVNGDPMPDVQVRIPLAMTNRHGLVAGATGTGKTRTLQVLAEQLAANGVAVFAADIKGDLSGIATPGEGNEKLLKRTEGIGQAWSAASFPVEFFSLGGIGRGVPIRATVAGFGPLLLSKVLGLNDTQESSLGLVFHYAENAGLALLDLEDLRSVLQYLTSDEGKVELEGLGGLSKATVGVILRELVAFAEARAPTSSSASPRSTRPSSCAWHPTAVASSACSRCPASPTGRRSTRRSSCGCSPTCSTTCPRSATSTSPSSCSSSTRRTCSSTTRRRTSCSRSCRPCASSARRASACSSSRRRRRTCPADVLAQLGSRVQHQLRAFTPDDAKALRATVSTYPKSGYDLEEVLTSLGTGEAIVTVMNEKGAPSPVAWTRLRAPQALDVADARGRDRRRRRRLAAAGEVRHGASTASRRTSSSPRR